MKTEIIISGFGGQGVLSMGKILAYSGLMEGKEITKLSDGVWRVDGRFPVEDAAALGWPVSESEDYETIAGWLIDTLDFVPEMGDEFTVGGYSFKIERMRRSRISTIRVERLAGGADVAEEGEGQQEKTH